MLSFSDKFSFLIANDLIPNKAARATPYVTQEREIDLDQYVAASLCTR